MTRRRTVVNHGRNLLLAVVLTGTLSACAADPKDSGDLHSASRVAGGSQTPSSTIAPVPPQSLSAEDAAAVLVANYAALTRRVVSELVAPADYSRAGIAPDAKGVDANLAIYADDREAGTWDKDSVRAEYSIQSVRMDGADAATVKATIGLIAGTSQDANTIDSAEWVTHVIRIEKKSDKWLITSDDTDPAKAGNE